MTLDQKIPLEQKISDATSLIQGVFAENGGAACVTCSFQTECMALVDLVIAAATQYPRAVSGNGLSLPRDVRLSGPDDRTDASEPGKSGIEDAGGGTGIALRHPQPTAPDRCCGIRKVEPLFRGLGDYGVWFTALRRDQSPTRANLQALDHFKLPTGHQLLKVSPLADWTNADVWAYLKQRGIPVLPLYDQGYTSIGCAPCTTPPVDPDNPRSGRWSGQKLECGIHIQSE